MTSERERPARGRAQHRAVQGPGERLSRWLVQLPYALVVCGVAGGLALFALRYFRKGATLVALAVLVAAVARLLLPDSRIGLLAGRGRWLDASILVGFAVAIAVVAWVVPAK